MQEQLLLQCLTPPAIEATRSALDLYVSETDKGTHGEPPLLFPNRPVVSYSARVLQKTPPWNCRLVHQELRSAHGAARAFSQLEAVFA